MLTKLQKNFSNRDQLISFVALISIWQKDFLVNEIVGGEKSALEKLSQIDPQNYLKSRNI